MKEDQNTNELHQIRRALLQAAKEDYLEALKDAPEAPPFSKNHRRWERRFLKDPFSLRTPHHSLWQRGLRTAACFVFVTSVVFGSVMVGSPTARAAVVRWFVTEYDDHIAYDFKGQAYSAELGDWEITKLPTNYRETKRIKLETMVYVLYEANDANETIELNYQLVSEGSGFNLDNEWHTVSDVKINGIAGKLFTSTEPEGTNMVFWVDESTEHAFVVTSSFPCEVLLELAKNVAPVGK